MNIIDIPALRIHALAATQYEREKSGGRLNFNEIYLTPYVDFDADISTTSESNLMVKIIAFCKDSVKEVDRIYRLVANFNTWMSIYNFANGLWIFELIKHDGNAEVYISATNGSNTITFTYNPDTDEQSELEHSNPPMISGWEYRTNERHNGNVVYVIQKSLGSGPREGQSISTDISESAACPIRYTARAEGTHPSTQKNTVYTLPYKTNNLDFSVGVGYGVYDESIVVQLTAIAGNYDWCTCHAQVWYTK